MQVPWLRQGLEAHSLMLVWQLGPKVVGLEITLGLDISQQRHALSVHERWTSKVVMRGRRGL